MDAGTDDTMLDAMLRQDFRDLADHLEGRKKRSHALHPHATRAVFAGTHGRLSETNLLDMPVPKNPDGGTSTHDFGKQHRAAGGARPRKPSVLRAYGMKLLASRKVDKAEVAKGWALALIHMAALEVVHDARPDQLEWVRRQQEPLAELLIDG